MMHPPARAVRAAEVSDRHGLNPVSFRVEKNVMVRMSDGVYLATDLWIPDHPHPRPTLLIRLPYGKDNFPGGEIDYPTMPNIFRLLDAGYALVYQDCRGTGRSEGNFEQIVNEARDGADTIAWLRDRDWCDGSIGTFGHSYLGITQWASSSQAPAGLRAIAPTMTTADPYRAPWYSEGGALSWHALWTWTNLMLVLQTNDTAEHARGAESIMTEALAMLGDTQANLEHLPLLDHPLYRDVWPWWTTILTRTGRDQYWQDMAAIERVKDMVTPALHIGGWFDIFVGDTARTYVRATADAATPEARDGQRLVIGPWDHMHFTGEYHDRQFGLASSVPAADLTQLHLDFFDRYVRGLDDAPPVAPVRIFVMGLDEWRDETAWPLPDTVHTDFFLTSSNGANGSKGDGALVTSAPAESRADTFTYDPADPVPSVGGRVMAPASLNVVGPADQSAVEERDDVLCYSTDILQEAIEVTGHVEAVLFVSTTARDTDFTAKLVDVFPDGRSIYLTDGIIRMRYRKSVVDPSSVEPGTVYEVRIDMMVTSNVFLPGHRIRVEVSSSNFPRFARNSNTGDDQANDGVTRIAKNRVLLGADTPSRLILPIISRSRTVN